MRRRFKLLFFAILYRFPTHENGIRLVIRRTCITDKRIHCFRNSIIVN